MTGLCGTIRKAMIQHGDIASPSQVARMIWDDPDPEDMRHVQSSLAAMAAAGAGVEKLGRGQYAVDPNWTPDKPGRKPGKIPHKQRAARPYIPDRRETVRAALETGLAAAKSMHQQDPSNARAKAVAQIEAAIDLISNNLRIAGVG